MKKKIVAAVIASCIAASAQTHAGLGDFVKSVTKPITKTVETVVKNAPAVVAPVATVVVKTASGDKPEEAAKDVVQAHTENVKVATEATASVRTQTAAAVGDHVVEPIAGKEANKTFKDIDAVGNHHHDVAAVAAGVDETVKTGDLNHLNPINMKARAEIARVRDQYWNSAKPLPALAMAAMPDELKGYAAKARYILESDFGSLNVPNVALKERNAIVMGDLIFVNSEMPYNTDLENQYFWVHEVYHVKQYAEMGLTGFTTKYMDNEMGFDAAGSDGINPLEREADEFACAHYPVGEDVAYIPECASLGTAGEALAAQ